MSTKKSLWILFGILVIAAWLLGSAVPVGAETLNYKFYTWSIKGDWTPVPDVEGHAVGYGVRGSFVKLLFYVIGKKRQAQYRSTQR
jgi:sugar phosphate permease